MNEKQVNLVNWEKFKSVIKFSFFLKHYCGITPTSRHRMRALMKDQNGNPVDFTDEEYQKINKGIRLLKNDLKSLGARI